MAKLRFWILIESRLLYDVYIYEIVPVTKYLNIVLENRNSIFL